MDEDRDQERSWSDLPLDILCLIRQSVSRLSPSLMTFIDDVKCKFYHPIINETCYMDFPQLHNTQIRSSNFGWLLMSEGKFSLFFFNPFTFERIKLPQLPEDFFDVFHFSSQPSSSSCTVTATSTVTYDTFIGIIKRGESKWSITGLSRDECKFTHSFCNTVFLDDRYYFMGDDGNIGIFDVKANKYLLGEEKVVPHRKRYSKRPLGMVGDNNGWMLLVYEDRDHRLNVATYDVCKRMWEPVDCLGDDKVLYVSRWGSLSETSGAKGMGNKIYFPKFHNGNGVYYSLATNKYHSSDGSYCSPNTYRLSETRFSAWIKPTCSDSKVENWSDDKSKIVPHLER